jgi:hypothetical protein
MLSHGVGLFGLRTEGPWDITQQELVRHCQSIYTVPAAWRTAHREDLPPRNPFRVSIQRGIMKDDQ